MGSSSSCCKKKKFHKANQMPSGSKITPTPQPYVPHNGRMSPISIDRRRQSIPDDAFELETNIEQYSEIWNQDAQLSSSFQRSSTSNLNHIEHHQKETLNKQWNKKSSTNFNSAHIESIVDTQIHSCINLSSPEKIDVLMRNLNELHTRLDEKIKERTKQISIDTESILSHIRMETQQNQQRLLNYAKQQQMKQDESYQKSLQDYISQLDKIKVKQLADLQKQLQIYREQILEESHLKIMTVNKQANTIKAQILNEEQQQAAERINAIISQIQKTSADEKLQHLGAEIRTSTNVTTNAKVGTKASGQDCNFNFNQNGSSKQRPQSTNKNNH